jgi:hypothetical protein
MRRMASETASLGTDLEDVSGMNRSPLVGR